MNSFTQSARTWRVVAATDTWRFLLRTARAVMWSTFMTSITLQIIPGKRSVNMLFSHILYLIEDIGSSVYSNGYHFKWKALAHSLAIIVWNL